MTTEEKFNAAVNVIRNLPKNGAYQPSHELKLRFYAYFKQATEGPCSISKPSFWDIVGRSKYEAWKKLGNMSKSEAMENYIEELKKIVETMSYNDNVGMFLGSLGNFYDNVPVEDIEMLLGPVIEKVRSRPGSPLQNSPLGSRETSPVRTPRHTLANKNYTLSSETSPHSSMSPSPQPPDTDDDNEEFIDTVETTPHASRKIYKNDSTSVNNSEIFDMHHSKEKNVNMKLNGHVNSLSKNFNSNGTPNGNVSHSNGLSEDSDGKQVEYTRSKTREKDSYSAPKRKSFKSNGVLKPQENFHIPDLSEQLRDTVFHLQKDLDRITTRVRNLEVITLSQPQVALPSVKRRKFFPEISRSTLVFIVVWPFVAQLLMKVLQLRKLNSK